MDCAKLHQDIAKLTELRDKLEGQLAYMNETGKGKGEMKVVMAEAEQFEEEALTRYLDDFAEKNPELSGEWEFGELIEGLEDEDGNERGVRVIARMPNGNMLVGGGHHGKASVLREFRRSPLTVETLRRNLDELAG